MSAAHRAFYFLALAKELVHSRVMSRKAANVRDARFTNEITPQPRGFRLMQSPVPNGRTYYVRLGYRLEACKGEAHSNAYIDHCEVCLGGCWGVVAVKIEK